MCARWIVLTEFPTLPVIRSKRPPRLCSATRSKYVILLYRSLHVPPESWDRSADTSWNRSYQRFVTLHAHLALDSPLESFVCYVMACARQNDSTLTVKNKLAGWDAPMSQIVFPTTSALSSLTSSLLFGETLGSTFEKVNCFTTSSLKPLLRSLQCGIVVNGVIDAFQNAHHYHRHNANNPGNFEDCMKGRIHLLTAITPRYAHAYQSLCRVGRPFDFPHQRFRLPSVKAKNPNLT